MAKPMTVLRTTTVEIDEDKIRREADRMDELYEELSKFVSEHGPRLLTRGMSQIEAHEAILECLKYLDSRIEKNLEGKLKKLHEVLNAPN